VSTGAAQQTDIYTSGRDTSVASSVELREVRPLTSSAVRDTTAGERSIAATDAAAVSAIGFFTPQVDEHQKPPSIARPSVCSVDGKCCQRVGTLGHVDQGVFGILTVPRQLVLSYSRAIEGSTRHGFVFHRTYRA
jgi:hypothetical protein